MSNFGRQLRLRDLLLTRYRHWSLRELSEELEEPEPVVESDLTELYLAGVPVESNDTDSVEPVWYIADHYQQEYDCGGPLPPVSLVGEDPILEALSETETTNVLDHPPPGHRKKPPAASTNALDQGAEERRVVRVTYEPRDRAEPITFDVEPVDSFSAGKEHFHQVRVLPSREPRTLTTWRILDAQLLDPKHKFRRWARNKAYGMSYCWHEHVEVRFDKRLADFISERSWHPSQRMSLLPDGSLVWRGYVSGMQEFIGWVMSWGPRAQLIAPEAWRDELRKRLGGMVASYQEPLSDLH